MAELYKSRLKFPKGQQRIFILKSSKIIGLTHSNLASLVSVSSRTLTDWKREKFLMNIKAARMLSRKSKVLLPKKIEVRDPFWYVSRASSSRGGIAVYKKYGRVGGDPEYRKKKWREWWEREGRFKPHPIINVVLPIKKPENSEALAEFVGIVMGDGGISRRQLTITLHREDDKEYIKFVIRLIKELFGVIPGIYHDLRSPVDDIVVSRTELVRFCTERLELKVGNKIKQQIDIPGWIKRNRRFRIACVRGLVDTDGSIFTHNYKVNCKLYSYKKLAFTSRSKPLLLSVYNALKEVGLKPRLAQKDRDVRLDSIGDMQKYFRIIGSHNPKHLKRYKN